MKNGFTKGRIVNFLNVNVTNFRAYKILIMALITTIILNNKQQTKQSFALRTNTNTETTYITFTIRVRLVINFKYSSPYGGGAIKRQLKNNLNAPTNINSQYSYSSCIKKIAVISVINMIVVERVFKKNKPLNILFLSSLSLQAATSLIPIVAIPIMENRMK